MEHNVVLLIFVVPVICFMPVLFFKFRIKAFDADTKYNETKSIIYFSLSMVCILAFFLGIAYLFK